MTQPLSPAERAALAARGWYDAQQRRGERLDPASMLLYRQLGAIYAGESASVPSASATGLEPPSTPVQHHVVRPDDVSDTMNNPDYPRHNHPQDVIQPRLLSYKARLAKRVCGHGAQTLYNLAIGYCCHVDGSECDDLMGDGR